MSDTDTRTAEILLEVQTSILQPHVSADKNPEQPGNVQRLAKLDSESPKSAASPNQAAGYICNSSVIERTRPAIEVSA